ncbi:MAG: hypothetical protein QG596_1636 [Actinomycetota bacterium]|nr:hypothetical protein [Actinomycetota bacterium]
MIGSHWAAGWYSKRQLRIQREQYEAVLAAETAAGPAPEVEDDLTVPREEKSPEPVA